MPAPMIRTGFVIALVILEIAVWCGAAILN